LRKPGILNLGGVFLICSLSIIVDNPNLFILAPVGLFALSSLARPVLDKQGLSLSIRPRLFVSLLFILPGLFLFGWYNLEAHQSPLTLAGTLPTARVEAQDLPGTAALPAISPNREEEAKSALNFFNTRNSLQGLYIFFLSPDRGMIEYSPIILLGFLGLYFLFKKDKRAAALILAVIGAVIILYSMWGDPEGGWGFGSRYLIPAYAMLGVSAAFLVPRIRANRLYGAVFIAVFAYSAWINSLGALTSLANPPKAEVLELEKRTGREQKYTHERNLEFLRESGSKSFAFNGGLKSLLTAEDYWRIYIACVLIAFGAAYSKSEKTYG
jgi:hypothetical protein